MIDINELRGEALSSWDILDMLFTTNVHSIWDLGKAITITSDTYTNLYDNFGALTAMVLSHGYALSIGVCDDVVMVSVLSDETKKYRPLDFKYYVQFDDIKGDK